MDFPPELLRRIAVHEAGHVVFAIRHQFALGKGGDPDVDVAAWLDDDGGHTAFREGNLLDYPGRIFEFSAERIKCTLRYLAAGLAAERLLLSDDVMDGTAADRRQYRYLSRLSKDVRPQERNRFYDDVAAVLEFLNTDDIEAIANELIERRRITYRRVLDLLNAKAPWDIDD